MQSATRDDESLSLEQSSAQLAERPPCLPGGLGAAGHLQELARDNLALFRRCAELGGITRFRVYWYVCHVVTDPELAGVLLVNHHGAFKKTRALQIARPTFGNGLVTSEGEAWRRQQRLLRQFFTPRAVAGHRELIAEATAKKLSTWGLSAEVDLRQAMIDVSLDVVCRALFGLQASRLQPLIQAAAEAVQRWHTECQALCLPYPHYWPTASNLRYRRRCRALDHEVYRIIRELRLSGGQQHGVLGAMFAARDEDGSAMSDREIRDQVVTLFLAGHDTTAASLAFALYELSYRPDLQASIAADGRVDQNDDLERVLKETLRLYPAVHLVARTAVRDVTLGRFSVRRGEEVVLPLYVMQRRPQLFEHPDEFLPERWAAACPVAPRHAYLPFSTGPRVCIGQALATSELQTIIHGVLSRYRLQPLASRDPQLDSRMTLAPAPGSVNVRTVLLQRP